ncbi:MAG: hypothetical protein ABSB35_41115, partial [Bryobacteraceae bacterium]
PGLRNRDREGPGWIGLSWKNSCGGCYWSSRNLRVGNGDVVLIDDPSGQDEIGASKRDGEQGTSREETDKRDGGLLHSVPAT